MFYIFHVSEGDNPLFLPWEKLLSMEMTSFYSKTGLKSDFDCKEKSKESLYNLEKETNPFFVPFR